MNTDQVHVERRAAQRFDFHLPVTIQSQSTGEETHAFTQDLSGRGALLYTDSPLNPGDAVLLTLVMPAEITLTENMRVCCRGTVVRALPASPTTKATVAVHLERYEFLPEARLSSETSAGFSRISALHERNMQDDSPLPAKSLHRRTVRLG